MRRFVLIAILWIGLRDLCVEGKYSHCRGNLWDPFSIVYFVNQTPDEGCKVVGATKLLNIIGSPKELLFKHRLVVGEKAKQREFPFIASIRIKYMHFCAGAIINKDWIITAANCKNEKPLEDFTVKVGTSTLNVGGNEYKIKQFIVHPEYSKDTMKNDIALIQLNESLTFDKTIQPVIFNNDISDNQLIMAVGWGYTSSPGTTSNDLMYIFVTTASRELCQEKYGEELIGDDHLCIYADKGYGVCSGDSGGPATANGKLYGVATWSRPCRFDGLPDVFTRTNYFYDWVQDVINQ